MALQLKINQFSFILLILCQTYVFSQKESFIQLSVNEGLSHSDARCMAQDDYSYLWIGTNSGLNSYDGYSIKTYKWEPNDFLSIPGNRILKLITTKDKVWVLIENKGLFYFDLLTKNFTLVKKLPTLNPHNFMLDLDQKENLWLFQKDTGLMKFSNISSLKDETREETILFRKKEVLLPNLRKLIKVGDEKYFISDNGKIYKYSKEINELILYDSFNDVVFHSAYIYNTSNILISLDNGLFLWNSIMKTKRRVPIIGVENISKKINCIYKEEDTYYLGTENGLYKASLHTKDGLKLFIDDEVISNVLVNAIFKDKFNILWIASSGYGLFYRNLEKLPFGYIAPSKENIGDLSKNYTSAILKERNENILWLGTKNGLFLYNSVSKTYTGQIKELEDKHIRFLFQDSQGEIWVGTYHNGVYRYRNKKLIKHYTKKIHNDVSVSSNHIISISEDYLGRIWLANFGNGIDIYDKNTNVFQRLFSEPFNKQSLISNNLNYLFYDKEMKFMYVSTRDSGISVVDLNDKTKFNYKHIGSNNSANSLSTNYIWSINSSVSDTLFVGTIGGGLNILKKDANDEYHIEYITRKMGLADNDVESVLLDSENRVWMGGRGLSVYDLKTRKITNYDVNDGLQSNSFKIGSSFYDVENNIMYFGGVNGVNFFNPNLIKRSKVPSGISITGIEIFNKEVNIGDIVNDRVLLPSRITNTTTIDFKAEENDFSIKITPLNFIAPEKNKIRYKLVPYQKEWIVSSYPHFKASYANLPAGEYVFEVQASSKDDVWPSENSHVRIQIGKYWYLNAIAICIYIVCFLGLVYLYNIQTSNRRKIKEKLIIAKKEQLLNQGKLDFFTKISHEIRTPLTLIAGPLKDLIQKRKTVLTKEEVLISMSRHVNRLLDMTNKLLDFRKMELGHDVLSASSTEINEFVYDIFMFFKGKAFSKVINYEFIKLSQEVVLYVDREKIETILINLLSNAFKFTPNNGSIILKMEIKGNIDDDTIFNKQFEPIKNYLKMSITDTGVGIPLSKKDKIFNQYYQIEENSSFENIGNGIGLALVKSICDLHHIKIEVETKTKKGSSFSLRIPLGKNYLGDDEVKDEASYVKYKSPIVLHQTSTAKLRKNSIDLVDVNISNDKKILIVEDNKDIRLYLNEHLKEYFKVLNAENGVVGFEIALKEKPDIIISDVMMPEMDGMEFCRLIKTNDSLHHIPIILLTALASTSHELEGLKLGIEDYIRKPFDIDLLLAKIFTILENRKYVSEYYSKQLHFTPDSSSSLTEDEIFLQKLIKFIEENFTEEEFNVAFISNYMAMGRTKLYVKIKDITGKSIIEFVRDIKLRSAENLLLNTSQTIEQISYQVGINDLKYFRKHFKARYKLSPSIYRKSKLTN